MKEPLPIIRANGFRLVPNDNVLNLEFSRKNSNLQENLAVELTHRIVCTDRNLVNLICTITDALAEPKPIRRRSGKDNMPSAHTRRDVLGLLPNNLPQDPMALWSDKLRNGLDSLGYPLFEERSIRFTPGQFEANRFLLGLERRQLLANDIKSIRDLLCSLELPENYVDDFVSLLPNFDWLHFGFESGHNGILIKAYLEYDKKDASEPYVRHHAWKWSPITKRPIQSTYWCHPRIDLTQIKERMKLSMRPVVTGSWMQSAQHCLEFCSGSLDLLNHHSDDEDIVYLEVDEATTLRHSFDVAFYGSGLRVCDVDADLRRLCVDLKLDMKRVDLLVEQVRGYELGHIASGLHNDGQPFCTIYFGAQLRKLGL